MHNKPYLVPQISKKSSTVGGGYPHPTSSPFVSKRLPPTPCTAIIYTFRARFDVNLTFITHPKPWFLVPKFPKSPHTLPLWYSITPKELLSLPPTPPPPLMHVRQKFIAQTYSTFRAKIRNSGKKLCAPPQTEMVPYAYDHHHHPEASILGGGGRGKHIVLPPPPPPPQIISTTWENS